MNGVKDVAIFRAGPLALPLGQAFRLATARPMSTGCTCIICMPFLVQSKHVGDLDVSLSRSFNRRGEKPVVQNAAEHAVVVFMAFGSRVVCACVCIPLVVLWPESCLRALVIS